jgi:hypothetical protein
VCNYADAGILPPEPGLGAPNKIEYVRMLGEQGESLSQIAAKTSIPKTSPYRYLVIGRPHQHIRPGKGDHVGAVTCMA